MAGRPRTEVHTHIEVDLGDRNRLTVLVRPLLAIPAIILASLLTTAGWNAMETGKRSMEQNDGGLGLIPLTVFLPALLLLLFMGFYPSWLLAFAHGVQSFTTKVLSYLLLLRDEYPTVRETEHTYVLYPDIDNGQALSRGLALVKWFLAIPHYVVFALAMLGALLMTLLAWFAIVFTGRYPASLAAWPRGVITYWNRIQGYAFTLVSDSYPRIRTE